MKKRRFIYICREKQIRSMENRKRLWEIYPKKLTVKFVDGICSPKVLRKLKAAWL